MQALLTLPGIGSYTAAAIASIAFAQPAPVMDGNVIRVLSRLFAIEQVRPKLDKAVYAKVEELTPLERPGDYAQAIMDLGATVCTPRNPECNVCPWSKSCKAFQIGNVLQFPRKIEKSQKPTRYGAVFILKDEKRKTYLLEKRPEKGLLGGLVFFPTTSWRESGKWLLEEVTQEAPSGISWTPLPPIVRHTFTHFHLKLQLIEGRISSVDQTKGVEDFLVKKEMDSLNASDQKQKRPPKELFWKPLEQFSDLALPTLGRKVVHAFRSV
ncbi:uncharacterized protein LOC111320449 [Stylophora pistillata]|uniref:uncharacterized protein LOC111320449 n=1 Tax=Stylophora pistillata TaxID=50429 RepID=UPI000C046DB9|nr:uncharacterized protein LOC111320449 [Stylophora pistillata]